MRFSFRFIVGIIIIFFAINSSYGRYKELNLPPQDKSQHINDKTSASNPEIPVQNDENTRTNGTLFDLRAHDGYGDGITDDTVAIQSLLKTVEKAGGGSIYIPKGIYIVSATLYVDSRVKIFGSGWNTIIRADNPEFHIFTLSRAASGSHFTNFQIQGAATTNKTHQFGFFTDSMSAPIGVSIDHLLISGPDSATGCNNGIKLTREANNWKINNNHFQQLIGTNSGHGYGILLGAAQRNIITDNHFFGGVGQGRHAVYLSAGAKFNIVARNIVIGFNAAAFPINTYKHQPPSQFNQIINNTIVNGGTLATNDSGAIGIYGKSSHNRVAGNTIIGYRGEGIIITDAGQGGLCIENKVIGNVVYNASRSGIIVMGGKKTKVKFNKVYNNSQSSFGTYSGIDVRSSGTFGTEICEDSIIVGNTSWGISQRTAFNIHPQVPAPTNTFVVGNVFLAGAIPEHPYFLNQVDCTFVGNVFD